MQLFHHTSREHRASIEALGLDCSFSDAAQCGGVGCVFLTDKPHHHKEIDCWIVNAEGLELEDDFTTEPIEGEQWFIHWGTISRERLSRTSQQRSANENL